jgi:TetR/AcrR family transcriptional regulator
MARRRKSASQDLEGTRDRILKAAEQVFAEKGYTGARVAEIAKRSGMDKRLIFYYFSNKQGLYSHILEDFFQRAEPVFDDFLRRRKDMAQKLDLARFLENTTEFIQANRNPVRILFREFLDGGVLLEELLPERILPIFALWREYYPRFFSTPRGSPREADHMLLTLGGMSLFYFLVVPLMEQVWEEDPLHTDRLSERKEFLQRRTKGLIK